VLDELRGKIDSIDNELLKLINNRMSFVKQIGEFKNKKQESIYRPDREQSILKRLHANSDGALSSKDIDAIFMEIFATSRSLELPERVAYLGPEGSFTHQAAKSRFGAIGSYVSLQSIEDVFVAVSSNMAKFGVVPIENNSNGMVGETLSGFSNYDVSIVAEVICDIHHCLVSNHDNASDIDVIYSKDIAFAGCANFLKGYDFKNKKLIEVESTAKAAQMAANNKNSAAICSLVAAKAYGLPVLYENIETLKNNKTRFFILSNFHNEKLQNAKTSILANLSNSPGSLVDFLLEFDKNKINLTKIKSHINEGRSLFFIDFNGHIEDDNVKNIIENKSVKYLGSYPKELDDI
jgi:chorismate mutase/prephenate dehydratase